VRPTGCESAHPLFSVLTSVFFGACRCLQALGSGQDEAVPGAEHDAICSLLGLCAPSYY
jgi:hypothetical protein